jgi:replication factor C small subunit
MKEKLWTEKYRPDTLDGYVFKSEHQKRLIQSWVDKKEIPHLLFSGSPGVGKTTLAKILINTLGVNDFDVLEINASRENSVDTIRDKIVGFVETMPFGDYKVVLLDEADYISHNGQAILRGVTEMYADTARFILTCNYPNKIMPALHSRFQGFHIDKTDITEFTARVATILVNEDIDFDLDTLDTYVKATYPDLRKCLNTCQMNSETGTLISPNGDESGGADWKFAAVDLFKARKYNEGRTLICQNVRPEEIEDVFRWMYDNLDLWGTTPEVQDDAILIIRDGLVDHGVVADTEINLSATLIELSKLALTNT